MDGGLRRRVPSSCSSLFSVSLAAGRDVPQSRQNLIVAGTGPRIDGYINLGYRGFALELGA
eukprot:m.170637 g.170637  ORF g.170637 m.170637 type:complete len:61 (+) comp17831_c3_seq1:192-374(+)